MTSSSPRTNESGEERDGRLVAGRYRLLSQVGQGGMGTVWRARDEMLDRDVAVKEVRPRPELSESEREEQHRRTLREARASARLNHPGVVTVHDVVDEDGRPWIVMELVRARSLQQIVETEGPLPPSRAAAIGRQVVAALRAAHAIGILHRDVKPANVLITHDDRAVLTDFGIAQVAGDATLTRTGLLVGSPAYMSPERVRGERAIPASDLWAVGATLYAACEGRPPYHRGDTMAVLAAIMTQDPAPPRNAGELGPVLYGLLQRDPAQRMRAEQAEEALAGIANGAAATVSVPAPRPPDPMPQGVQAGDQGVQGAQTTGWGPSGTIVTPGPPGTAYAPQPPAPGGGRRGMVLPVLAGALVALVIVGVAAFVLWPDDRTGDPVTLPSPSASAQAGERAPSDEPVSGNEGENGNGNGTSASPSFSLPPGLVRQDGPGGYTIGVPQRWTRQERGNSTFWHDPESEAYVQVDRTPWTGDPEQHWIGWEREVIAANSLLNYQRVDLTRTSVDGHPAADLEFTWTGKHGIDRGIVVDGRSYAVFVAVPESRWNEYRVTVNNVIDSFRP